MRRNQFVDLFMQTNTASSDATIGETSVQRAQSTLLTTVSTLAAIRNASVDAPGSAMLMSSNQYATLSCA
jgi:hypothetical protein